MTVAGRAAAESADGTETSDFTSDPRSEMNDFRHFKLRQCPEQQINQCRCRLP